MSRFFIIAAYWATVPLAVARTATREFTVFNACPYTVWPAIFTDVNVGKNLPNYHTGWQADPLTAVTFQVPNDWKSGRIWGRSDCDFGNSSATGSEQCLTGGCAGGLECDVRGGTGDTPATLAEWTLGGDDGTDFLDVSVVDGFNIPIRIDNSVGCPVADCPADLNAMCPTQLRGSTNSSGSVAACKSACGADLDGDPNNSANCCTGDHNTAATCPNSTVQFYSFFKTNCPRAYAYAFDESSNTALWTCNSSLNANYTLTFCPPSDAASATPSPTQSTFSTASLTPKIPSGTAHRSATDAWVKTALVGTGITVGAVLAVGFI